MPIEFEATFPNIDPSEVRAKLRALGAELIYPEVLQKREVFNLPVGHEVPGHWARVRDEGNKITMSFKITDGGKIEDQKELCLTIDSFEVGAQLLESLGCRKKAYQETRRELWQLDGAQITIDFWPWLAPFVEVEGESEEQVKSVSTKLGFDYNQALFCSVGKIYSQQYGISEDIINNHTPRIVFDGKNPFI